MLYATSYQTNLGVLSALPRGSMLARVYGFRPSKRYRYAHFADESNHTSIREGIALSGITKFTYTHRDMEDLRKKLKSPDASTKTIVTDGVFSMDGDFAPLPKLINIADEIDATIYVDDALGTGVIGEHGGGGCEHFGVSSPRLISMGTLSKAYGATGGFIAMESYICETLRFTTSTYYFTSKTPPDQTFAVSTALDIVKNAPERRERLWNNQRYFVKKVEQLEMPLVSKEMCIAPVLIGD